MSAKISFELSAVTRHERGRGASRRLRHQEKVPGVVYGGGSEAVSLTLEHREVAKALSIEAFYSHILTLKTGTNAERVILKAVQRHPFKPRITHLDFQRVRADEKLHMHIPLHFLGEEKTPGVVEAGGIISHILGDVEVSCLPDHLPEYIEVDISNMQLNDILHLSDLKMPANVEIVALAHGDDKAVVSVHMPRIEEEPEPTEVIAAGDVPSIEQSEPTDEEAGAEEGKGKK